MPILPNPATGAYEYSPGIAKIQVVNTDVTVTNSDTLTAATALTVALGPYERVILRYNVFYTTTATGDFKYQLNIPTTPTYYHAIKESNPPAATALVTAVEVAEGATTSLAASGTDGFVRVVAVVENGATGGDITFEFAQNTATSGQSAVVRNGSFVEAIRY